MVFNINNVLLPLPSLIMYINFTGYWGIAFITYTEVGIVDVQVYKTYFHDMDPVTLHIDMYIAV